MAYDPTISLGGTPSQITYFSTTSQVTTLMVGAGAAVNSTATTVLAIGATSYSMCQSLDGNSLFVATSTVINMYRRSGGGWTFVASATHNLATAIQTLRVSPNGRWLIALNASTGVRLYTITPGSIALAQTYTTTVGSFNSCTWMPDSVFFVLSASAGISVCYINNASTGTITFPTTATLSGGVNQVVYLPNEANKITLACAGTVSPYFKVVQFSTTPGNGFAPNEQNGAYSSSTAFPTTVAYNYTVAGASGALRGIAVNNTGTLIVAGISASMFTYVGNPSNQNSVTFGSSKIGSHAGTAYNLAFSPSGTQLMIGATNIYVAQISGSTIGTVTNLGSAQPGTAAAGSWGPNWTGN
jgi:WD40 repeat protein